ncbi:MAG: hypothetical protein ACREXP_20215, partial [Steroidobacteraceae bacterium]
LEFRWGTNNFGVAPIVIRDFDEKVTGVELPLFLVHDEPSEGQAGPLTGGVKLGWRSDTDDITVGLFIGASLALGFK